MSTSAVFAVRLAVKALFTTALASTPSVIVYSGVPVVTPGKDSIYVGAEDLPDETGPAGAALQWINAVDAKQDWHANISRLEEFDLKCVALSWTGASEIETAYATLQSYLSTVERALLTSPGLGISDTSLSVSAGMSLVGIDLVQSTAGPALKCRFSVIGQARIV